MISERFGYTHLDTDNFFWEDIDPPYTVKRNKELRISLLSGAVSRSERWVLSGSICGWGDFLVPEFDLVVLLSLPGDIRINRLIQREQKEFGRRIEPGGDMEENFNGFIEWAKTYDDGGLDVRSRKLHLEWKKKLSCPVLELDSSASLEGLMDSIGLN